MHDKTVIITGASSGIGKATVELLTEDYAIVGLSRSNGYDVTEKSIMDDLHVENVYGIINNAGVCIKKPYHECNIVEWNETINTNLRPIWLLAKKFRGQLTKNEGCIINISSIHSVATLENNALYAMSKGAIESLTRALAVELASSNVRVNCIRPGPIMTKMLAYEGEMRLEELEKTVPLGRIGKPHEVAKTIRFLLSEEASFITGECITVDGGVLAKLSVGK